MSIKTSPPFRKFEAWVACVPCQLEMPQEDWPGHYRTKVHRGKLQASKANPWRAFVEFVADWANDCKDGDTFYGFAHLEAAARALLDGQGEA